MSITENILKGSDLSMIQGKEKKVPTEFIKERDLLSARSEESQYRNDENQLESKFTNRGPTDEELKEDKPLYDELFKKLKRT